MFKFKYNTGDVKIDIQTDFSDAAVDAVTELMKVVSGNTECVPTSIPIRAISTESIEEPTTLKESDEDRPYLRERLPNNSEIKVGDYEAVSSKTTAHFNFMCSKCYQSMSIKVGSNIIIKDIDSANKELHMLESSYVPENNFEMLKLTPTELGQLVEESDVTILASEELYGSCINCGNHETTVKWVENYKNKLSITGCDENCPICGTEMMYNIDTEGNSVHTCDNKDCLYVLK